MSYLSELAPTILAAFTFAMPANAQAPQVEKNVSMKMALMIIEGTIEQCSKDGHRVSVVIVDRAGAVAASVRGDGTNPHTVEFARLKAYTARTNPRGMTSQQFKNLLNSPGGPPISDRSPELSQ